MHGAGVRGGGGQRRAPPRAAKSGACLCVCARKGGPTHPAKSTKHSLDVRAEPVTVSLASTRMVRIECEREDASFMPVAPTARCTSPTRTSSISSSGVFTYSSVTPSTYTPCSSFWRMVRFAAEGLSRSRTRSR